MQKSYRYIAVGASLVNNLVFLDGRREEGVLGGCGFYAYAGLRTFEPQSLFVSQVGEDYERYYGPWLDRNGVSREGLLVEGPNTHLSVLTYLENGDYTEVSALGGGSLAGKRELERRLCLDSIAPYIGPGTRGLYLFGRWMDRLGGAYELARSAGAKVMWEVTPVTYFGITDYYDEFLRYLEGCDYYSLNRLEAQVIFGLREDGEIMQRISCLGKPCYYRMGTDGAALIDGPRMAQMPMISLVPREEEIDPTGCGNSSTAAAMWALCEGYGPAETAAIAGVAAAYNVRQYGPWPDMSGDFCSRALKEALAIAAGA